jgi:hypothetical protein
LAAAEEMTEGECRDELQRDRRKEEELVRGGDGRLLRRRPRGCVETNSGMVGERRRVW